MNKSSITRRLNLVAQLVVFLGMLVAFWQQRWYTGAAYAGILILMNIPLMVRRNLPLSPNTQLLMSLLLFAWLFLGELKGYFARIPGWDLFVHSFAGAVIALVGVQLAYAMTVDRPRLHRYAFSASFGFSLALAVGTLWEILEFGLDHLFGADLMMTMFGDASGLTDTVFDLLADAAGAGVACLYGVARFYRLETTKSSIRLNDNG
jgi:uncharacterized membrane protein